MKMNWEQKRMTWPDVTITNRQSNSAKTQGLICNSIKQCNQSENQHCRINSLSSMSMKDFFSLCLTFSQSELIY